MIEYTLKDKYLLADYPICQNGSGNYIRTYPVSRDSDESARLSLGVQAPYRHQPIGATARPGESRIAVREALGPQQLGKDLGRDGASAPAPILDTSTPKLGSRPSSVGRVFNRRCRKLYSRVHLGLCLPGRYYFLTLTSSPLSPPLERSWDALRKWLKVAVPGICWCYCFTNEGHGVIHMVLRIHALAKNLDVRALRRYWKKSHKATQVRIIRVKHGEDLASYLANQKRKNRMAKEMGYQSGVTRWRWSKGWIPKGFTQQFGRIWVRTQALTIGERLKIVSDCINLEHEKQKQGVKV